MFKERIEKIQNYLKNNDKDAYLLFISDDHGSEYIPPMYKSLAFISGFTGSAGYFLITKDASYLWTDGRYFIQAANQIKEGGSILKKMGIDEPLSYFIVENLNSLVFDFSVAPTYFVKALLQAKPSLKLYDDAKVVDDIWVDKPKEEIKQLFKIPDELLTKNANQKCRTALNRTRKLDNFGMVISDLADVAYMTNLRGFDIAYNPVFVSFLFLTRNKGVDTYTLYVNEDKLSPEIKDYLKNQSIYVKPYFDIYNDVANYEGVIYYAPNKTNYKLASLIKNKKAAVLWPTLAKSVKTNLEIKEIKRIHVKDGVAMCKFLYYVKNNVGKIPMDEISIADKLEEFRREQGAFELSFDTICGYQEHGAIIHYSSTPETNVPVYNKGLLLVDSGGQYYYGTTDITRTIALKDVTDKQKYHFTLVLKSHIALANAMFQRKKSDKELDKIARKPLKDVGLDYRHGTGHGIGFCLNVHEGPQSISVFKQTPAKMRPGMITSDEPGLYFENEYGIRHENEILCVKRGRVSLAFEPITYVPFDLDGIEVSMLTQKEKDWLNDYHKMVYKKISGYLNDDERAFLRKATKEI